MNQRQPILTRESEILELNEASRAAGKNIILSFVVVVAASMLYITTFGIYYNDNATLAILVIFGVLFAGGWMSAIVNTMIFFRLPSQEDDEPSATNDASDTLTFDSDQQITTGRLEDHSDPNSIELGRFELSRNEWRKLAVTLSSANWKWTRRLLQKTHIWESLTINDKYKTVTEDFERVGAVKIERNDNEGIKSVRVTHEGREEICRLAGTPLL